MGRPRKTSNASINDSSKNSPRFYAAIQPAPSTSTASIASSSSTSLLLPRPVESIIIPSETSATNIHYNNHNNNNRVEPQKRTRSPGMAISDLLSSSTEDLNSEKEPSGPGQSGISIPVPMNGSRNSSALLSSKMQSNVKPISIAPTGYPQVVGGKMLLPPLQDSLKVPIPPQPASSRRSWSSISAVNNPGNNNSNNNNMPNWPPMVKQSPQLQQQQQQQQQQQHNVLPPISQGSSSGPTTPPWFRRSISGPAPTPTLSHRSSISSTSSRSLEHRHSHKLAERKRRREMKDVFDALRDLVAPAVDPSEILEDRKHSKWDILNMAVESIDELTTSEMLLLKKREVLVKQIEELTRRVPNGAAIAAEAMSSLTNSKTISTTSTSQSN